MRPYRETYHSYSSDSSDRFNRSNTSDHSDHSDHSDPADSQQLTANSKKERESSDRYHTYLRTLQWERRLPTLPILLLSLIHI